MRRPIAASLAILAVLLTVSGCHVAGHMPPGQVKKVVAPPPGQTVPPGQAKKF